MYSITPSTPQKVLLTVPELALYLVKSKSTIYKWTSRKQIPQYKKGKNVYFDPLEIIAWIKEGRVPMRFELDDLANDYINKQRPS